MKKMTATLLAAGLMLTGSALARTVAADGSLTPIAAITDSPDDFGGTQVTVAGAVAQQRIDFRGESVYSLDQGGRRITVISFGPSPAVGASLQVGGEVVVHPEGNSEIEWPPVLVESSRSVVP